MGYKLLKITNKILKTRKTKGQSISCRKCDMEFKNNNIVAIPRTKNHIQIRNY